MIVNLRYYTAVRNLSLEIKWSNDVILSKIIKNPLLLIPAALIPKSNNISKNFDINAPLPVP